jgi:hypothetical protein
MSLGHVDAKRFPHWEVAFVVSSIRLTSEQVTAVMSRMGWSVSTDDVSLSGHMTVDQNVRDGFGSEERNFVTGLLSATDHQKVVPGLDRSLQ